MFDQIKNKVRDKFNRAALTYDQSCSVQNAICLQAIYLLLNYQRIFDNIVDFGCGAGESTRHLMKHLNFNYCYAVDLAERPLAVARSKLSYASKINWIHSDFDQPIRITKPLELIFCNMGLQWSNDIPRAIHLWQNYLNNQGLLLFSIPITGNFPELKEAFKPSLLNHKEIAYILKADGWHLVTQEFKSVEVQFNNQIEALKALKATGVNYNKTITHQRQGLTPLKLDRIFTNPSVNQLTYKIGIYLARKIS